MADPVSKIKYGTSTAITITLASLGSSATVGRESTAIDNSTNRFIDALVRVTLKTDTGSIGNESAAYVYAYGSEDGTNYPENITGSDAAYTQLAPTVLRLIGVVPLLAQSTTYKSQPMSVAQAFGGRLPRKWGIVVRNYCGIAMTGTAGDHAAYYTGIQYEGVTS